MSGFGDVEGPVGLYQASVTTPQDKDEVLLTLSLKWSRLDQPQKLKTSLQKILQSWFNIRRIMLGCMVERALRDGSVVVKVTPAPALCDLQELNGQTLTGKDGNTVTILSISLTSTIQDSQKLDGDLMDILPSASELQQGKQSSAHSTATNTSFDEYKRSSIDCLVPLGHYWYLNNIYKEEIKHIETENKVQIKAKVIVDFEAKQEDGNPEGALSEFTKLVQSSLPNSEGSVIPLKFVDPDQWSDAMRVIQENRSKLLLTLSCEEVTLCGPSQSQDAFSAALNAVQKRNASPKENKPALRDTALRTEKAIKGPSTVILPGPSFVSQRQAMVYTQPAAKPKRESERKASTELLYHETTALMSSLRNSNVLSETQGSSTQHHTTALARDGDTAGDKEEDKCPICLDPFITKKRLNCKHEFCSDCLQQAEKHIGPICPVCKDVLGVMEGDQPLGTMTITQHATPLPGFPDCGHIVISYNIPSGVQTNKHPNPGQPFHGTCRVAYLPDNIEGNEVVLLLKKAFKQKLIFTVGTSRTTGAENQVIWNDVSHKTSMTGGPESFGYPDPNYLKRVKFELKAKGIQ